MITSQGVSLNEGQRKMLNKLMDGFEGKLTSSKVGKRLRSALQIQL